MKAQILIFIFTLTTIFLSSCKSEPDLSEAEVYTIINGIIADDTLTINRVCWKFFELKITDDYKKEFTEKDIEFIERQNEIFKNSKVKPNKLKWFRKRSQKFDFTTVDTLCDQGILYHVSFPLISVDRQKVIIEFQEDCNCMLGGHSGKKLYKKKNGRWVFAELFDWSISDNSNQKIPKEVPA